LSKKNKIKEKSKKKINFVEGRAGKGVEVARRRCSSAVQRK
jgi:hypothetical protein